MCNVWMLTPIPLTLLYWAASSSSPLVQTCVKAKLTCVVCLILCILQIVVATPGRLWELMQEGHAHLTDMSGLNFFVLDEADRMVQQGHFQVTTVHALMLLCFACSTALSTLTVSLILHDTHSNNLSKHSIRCITYASAAKMLRLYVCFCLPFGQVVMTVSHWHATGLYTSESGTRVILTTPLRHRCIVRQPTSFSIANVESLQEMEHILEHIKGSRAVDNSQPDEFDHRQKLTAEGPGNDDIDGDEDDDDENDGAAADEPVGVPEGHQSAKPGRQKRLQTMVFSATLTLPQHLRKRLKKGQLLGCNSCC